MALVIYDHGYRIKTPTRAEFPPKGVSELTALRATHRAADIEDKVHADGEKAVFVMESGRKMLPKQQSSATQAYVDTNNKTNTLQDRRNLYISHIMTTPVETVTPGATISAAAKRMEDLSIHHLVVVDGERRLQGMISERDLLRSGKNSPEIIDTICSKQVVAASPDTQVRQVAQAFVEHGFNAMPVVDGEGRVVGLVTRTDLLHLLVSGPNLERWA
jgi:CBS domain-containing protein